MNPSIAPCPGCHKTPYNLNLEYLKSVIYGVCDRCDEVAIIIPRSYANHIQEDQQQLIAQWNRLFSKPSPTEDQPNVTWTEISKPSISHLSLSFQVEFSK